MVRPIILATPPTTEIPELTSATGANLIYTCRTTELLQLANQLKHKGPTINHVFDIAESIWKVSTWPDVSIWPN